MNVLAHAANLGRGALIGTAEIVPGVSGGTIALIVGVYDDLINSAGHLVRGVVHAVLGTVRREGLDKAKEHLDQVRWGVVLPVGIGMLIAIVAVSALVAPLFEEHPVQTRAVFAGLIVASLVVPVRMVGGAWKGREYAIAAVVAAIAFALTSIPAVDPFDPPLPLVALAAAVAVCALVVPGLSGSFLLLTFGLYAPTLDAVNDRDLVYLGVFVLGAIIGLGSFVSVLQWLLLHRRRATLAAMTGLMVGSLRALWPWQTEDGGVLAPDDDLTGVVLLFVAGLVVVTAMVVAESVLVRRRALRGQDVLQDAGDEPVRDR